MAEQVVTITINEVSFKIKKEHDFQWLKDLGIVFAVFDEQDSGNICFGVISEGKKIFVKYAGAPTLEYEGKPEDAVERLREGSPLYSKLEHQNLIRLIEHREINSGYVAIFEWFEGECLHPHWAFAGWNKYNHPDSPFYRYKNLTVEKRLNSLDSIFSFHQFIESKGYIAVDFYDGSILYDFKNDLTKICDIDFYRLRPTINNIGQDFWGSKRLKSPEEFVLNAPIDEKTNVFNMGAIAFVLLGGELDRAYSKWEAGEELYRVALRAVNNERENRYSSVSHFYISWKSARAKTFG